MPGFDHLAPDQQAVLQLLLKRGKSYDEIAGMLRMDAGNVRERALDALDALGADVADGLAPERQDEIADHLLGQQTGAQRAATRTFLQGSAEGRAWARAVAEQLRTVAGDALPDIPAEPKRPAAPPRAAAAAGSVAGGPGDRDERRAARGERRAARDGEQDASRLGGILVLAAIAAVIALGAFLLLRDGGDDASSAASTPATATDGPTGATGASGAGGLPQQQINLTPPEGRDSKALGIAVLSAGTFAMQAEGLPASDRYDVWFYTSADQALPLGFAQYDRKTKTLSGTISQVPAEAAQFRELVVTRQRTAEPTKPGTIVLRGAVKQG